MTKYINFYFCSIFNRFLLLHDFFLRVRVHTWHTKLKLPLFKFQASLSLSVSVPERLSFNPEPEITFHTAVNK